MAKLQVSIIEARNVLADLGSEQDFYVKLKFAGQEVRTDVVRNSTSPKFLKDIRLDLDGSHMQVLKVELFQVGPRGDLVIGTEEIPLSSISNTGTLVQWFPLKDAARNVTAELCIVLRVSPSGQSGSASSTMSKARSGKTPARGRSVHRADQGGKFQIPLPLAIAAGALGCIAALGLGMTRKKAVYHEVQEGDTLCTIGECHHKNFEDLFKKNSDIVTDPNLIYPGDRLRIK